MNIEPEVDVAEDILEEIIGLCPECKGNGVTNPWEDWKRHIHCKPCDGMGEIKHEPAKEVRGFYPKHKTLPIKEN